MIIDNDDDHDAVVEDLWPNVAHLLLSAYLMMVMMININIKMLVMMILKIYDQMLLVSSSRLIPLESQHLHSELGTAL